MLHIIFFGSSDYCLLVLESLHKNFKLTAIITRSPSSPALSAGITTFSVAPEKFGLMHKIPVLTPQSAGEISTLIPDLKKFSPDLSVVADYGVMIPDDVISLPKLDTLNIHFSRLPKYRGPSPVQYTILHGEKSAWISIIKLVKKLDAGDIIYQKEVSLSGDETTGSLYKKLFNIISEDLPSVLSDFALGKIKPVKQDEKLATYTRKITKEDGFVPFDLLSNLMKGIKPNKAMLDNWPLTKIPPSPFSLLLATYYLLQSLRAFSPWPGLWTEVFIPAFKQLKRLKILKAHLEPFDSAQSKPTTHNPQPTTKLVLDQVQLEGKNPVSWTQFLEGYSVDY